MASRSHKYIMTHVIETNNNIKSSDSKKTALRHSMRINLDPLLELDKSLFDQIAVFHIKEGKA
jgi:hypothetical protein